MDTHDPRDGWTIFAELLGLVRNLFGDALKASDPLAPKDARDASRWLRAAEAFARVLLLVLARTMTPLPLPRRERHERAKRKTTAHGRSLFAAPSARRRLGTARGREEMSTMEMRAWCFFGGKERAAEERERREAERWGGYAPAPRAMAAPVTATPPSAHPHRRRAQAQSPSRANLVRRFNVLVRVFDAPDKAALRLARRLAAHRDLAARALASAHPRDRWRTGYDETIRHHARIAGAVAHDSS